MTATTMDITILPVTRSSKDIKENFLKQLSRWVDIEENPIKEDVQILIFKPTGRPKEEFDHLIEVFKDTGGRLDDVIIFITATKPDRVKFEVPEKYNFAYQTCVFLNDENEIDPRSVDAIREIADFLIHSCGFQPFSHKTSMLDVMPETSGSKSKAEDSRKGGNKIPTYDDLKRKLEEQEREIHKLQQENKREEKRDDKNLPQRESISLKRTESRGDSLGPVSLLSWVPFCGCCFGCKKETYGKEFI